MNRHLTYNNPKVGNCMVYGNDLSAVAINSVLSMKINYLLCNIVE